MSDLDVQKFNIDYDREKLISFLPESYPQMEKVLRLADEYSREEVDLDPLKGRAMMAELQSRIEVARDAVMQELMTKLRMVPDDDSRARRTLLRDIKIDLFSCLKSFNPIYFPDKSCEGGPYIFIKDQLVRCLTLSLIITLLKDADYCDDMERNLEKYQQVYDMPPTDRLLNRVASEDYALADEFLKFRALLGDVGKLQLKEGDRMRVRQIADDVFKDIMANRDYDLDSIYTYDKQLGTPMVVVFENCGHDRWQRDENMAVILLTNNKKVWDESIRHNQRFVLDLANGELMKQDISKQIELTLNGNKESAESVSADPSTDQSFVASLPSGVGSFIGAQAVGVRWTDGELVIPNAHIALREMFDTREQDWVELLRLSLLLKLRSLLVKNRPDVTVRIIDDLKKRKKGDKKTTITKLRSKVFPREIDSSVILQTRTTDIESMMDKTCNDVNSICLDGDISNEQALSSDARFARQHEVTGHRRVLPEGFYATEQAVQKAKALGITLASFADEDGVVRYTETYVKSHIRGGEGVIGNREGKFN